MDDAPAPAIDVEAQFSPAQVELDSASSSNNAHQYSLSTNIGDLLAAAGVLEGEGPARDGHSSAKQPRPKKHKDNKDKGQYQHEKPRDGRPMARLKGVPSLGTSPTALQDMFLNGLRREQIECAITLNHGAQENGIVRAFDTFTILLETPATGAVHLLYKHSIAVIAPSRSPQTLFDSPARKTEPANASS